MKQRFRSTVLKTGLPFVIIICAIYLISVRLHPTAFVRHFVHNGESTDHLSIELVQADGNLSNRIKQFNHFLDRWRKEKISKHLLTPWIPVDSTVDVIVGARDDYMQLLKNRTQVKTIALPWIIENGSRWNSFKYSSNLLLQRYYEWTADDPLCTWIETPGIIKLKYDAIYNRTCNRNIHDTLKPRSLRANFLNAKQIKRNQYWPNNGNFYPSHFYTEPPRFVFYLHVHHNAIVTNVGDVYSRNIKLVLYACSFDITSSVPSTGSADNIKLYDEVFVITQYWGTAVFHRMVEIVPRLSVYLDFLAANPNIRILAPEGPGGRLGQLLQIVGLNESRLITGTVRAKVAYQPRASSCGFPNVPESQVLSGIYRRYIQRTLPFHVRDRVVLIKRSGSRRFTEQANIEAAVERAAMEYNLTFALFRDNPTPSLRDTMTLFWSAAIVVAPHGAGLSNLMFSQPGTFVIEGVCNLPHVNFCFQRLAHVLGHHWHGIPSRGGCEGVVDVSTQNIDSALREYLKMANGQSK